MKKRLLLTLALLIGSALTLSLLVYALRSNIDLFYLPEEVLYGKGESATPPKVGQRLQVGGMVLPGSIVRLDNSLKIRFVLYDNNAELTVYYDGILPDLFGEGQSAVAQGTLQEDHSLLADKVLAKHDENYTPPEVAERISQQHQGRAQ